MRLEPYLRAAASRLEGSDTPHLDARLLAKAALGFSDAEIILAGDRQLTDEEAKRIEALVQRRLAGESVAHILGEKEFYGLSFRLSPGVLSPRPETETLIEAARRRIPADGVLRILDLGTGSGCILCALLSVFPNAVGVGVDVSPAAVACAADNARRLGFHQRASFCRTDWGEAIDSAFDLVVSNPPYIPIGDRKLLAPEVSHFEDAGTLFAGADGLDAFRRILTQAERLLTPDGMMILEFGAGQGETLVALATALAPWRPISLEMDLARRPRALIISSRPQKNI